jgi:hypothetical protein
MPPPMPGLPWLSLGAVLPVIRLPAIIIVPWFKMLAPIPPGRTSMTCAPSFCCLRIFPGVSGLSTGDGGHDRGPRRFRSGSRRK